MFKPAMSLLFTIALVVTALYFMAGTAAHAAAYRLEPADRPGGKVLAYVEPYRFKAGTPRRLFVEFRDGSAWVFTPCRAEDSNNCFWWASKRGNHKGQSFITLRNRTYYI